MYEPLQITESISPSASKDVAAEIVRANQASTPVYALGGCTSLNYGIAPRQPGIGLSLQNLNQVVDFPARDMTITLGAGVTVAELTKTLAAERQWLPIDVPHPENATIGGLVACGWNGPHRYGCGTIRDYVIGIAAVDGAGRPFRGGGRVVKNVAGYDFCKLLTGSLGTLGVITELTLKVRPRPERALWAGCQFSSLDAAERLLAALVTSETSPAAIELLTGPAWKSPPGMKPLSTSSTGRILVALEGTPEEVTWMTRRIESEWQALGTWPTEIVDGVAAEQLGTQLRDFSADDTSPLVIKATVLAGQVCKFASIVESIDPQASIQAHAGNGIVLVRFAKFDAGDVSRVLVGKLQPAAVACGGHVVVLSSSGLGELTRQAVWGNFSAGLWATRVKQQFDPKNVLNPDRFVYEHYAAT